MVVAALSRESLAAGWRIAGAKVDWQNAMVPVLSSFDGRLPLVSIRLSFARSSPSWSGA